MRISLRLILSLVMGVTLLSFLFSLERLKAEKRSLQKELENHAAIVGESLEGKVEPLLDPRSRPQRLQGVVAEFGNREHLKGIAIYDKTGVSVAITPGLGDWPRAVNPEVTRAIFSQTKYARFTPMDGKLIHVYILPLRSGADVLGALAVFHDASFITTQTKQLWWDTFLNLLAQAIFIALVTLLIIRWSIVGPIARTAKWISELRTGKSAGRSGLDDELFKPLAQEVTHLAKSLEDARAAAAVEARLRESAESHWTPERLRLHVRGKLGDRPFFVVSNREPYTHAYRGKNVEITVPASGLVTAIEPILRTCQGMWLAHGSGDADRGTVDERDCLPVPPDDPQYTLKRVWLSKEEEEGYYFGFSNEGLWPLCHMAHTRPIFRVNDWKQYQAVNRKFADSLIKEMASVEEPAVLVQDYHFALLPRLLKEKVPGARVAIFWHIPWPNPEAFAICPWQRELLEGLLGADLVGFHVQSHCNNFLATVDRAIESRVNWARFTVERRGHVTQVRPFPISVDCTETHAPEQAPAASPYLDRAALLKEHGVEATYMGVGVDRVDYTKGILERFHGIERFFERYPAYLKQFTFVQIGAPSRTHIERYHQLQGEVEAEAHRINWRFQTNQWKPILYLQRHHSHQEIQRYYKAADLCMVTSLHDGMNLVAKEFVAARHDDQGVLILSRFTGASHELRDAVIVNPYDTEQLAEAVHFALVMDPVERCARMHRMRQIVKDFNIYRWAADLTTDLCDIRLDARVEVA